MLIGWRDEWSRTDESGLGTWRKLVIFQFAGKCSSRQMSDGTDAGAVERAPVAGDGVILTGTEPQTVDPEASGPEWSLDITGSAEGEVPSDEASVLGNGRELDRERGDLVEEEEVATAMKAILASVEGLGVIEEVVESEGPVEAETRDRDDARSDASEAEESSSSSGSSSLSSAAGSSVDASDGKDSSDSEAEVEYWGTGGLAMNVVDEYEGESKESEPPQQEETSSVLLGSGEAVEESKEDLEVFRMTDRRMGENGLEYYVFWKTVDGSGQREGEWLSWADVGGAAYWTELVDEFKEKQEKKPDLTFDRFFAGSKQGLMGDDGQNTCVLRAFEHVGGMYGWDLRVVRQVWNNLVVQTPQLRSGLRMPDVIQFMRHLRNRGIAAELGENLLGKGLKWKGIKGVAWAIREEDATYLVRSTYNGVGHVFLVKMVDSDVTCWDNDVEVALGNYQLVGALDFVREFVVGARLTREVASGGMKRRRIRHSGAAGTRE